MKRTSLFLTILASVTLPACSGETNKEPVEGPAKGAPADPGKAGLTTVDLVLDKTP